MNVGVYHQDVAFTTVICPLLIALTLSLVFSAPADLGYPLMESHAFVSKIPVAKYVLFVLSVNH